MKKKRTGVLVVFSVLVLGVTMVPLAADTQRKQKNNIQDVLRSRGACFGYTVPRKITTTPIIRWSSGLLLELGVVEFSDLIAMNTSVEDDDLVILEGYKNLRSIELDNSRITDKGISHLTKIPQLEVLSLRNCDVTDNCIDQLGGIANLKVVFIDGTRITKNGKASLMVKLPECRIVEAGSPERTQAMGREFKRKSERGQQGQVPSGNM